VKEDGVQQESTPPSMAGNAFVSYINLDTAAAVETRLNAVHDRHIHRHRSRQVDRHALLIRMPLALIGLRSGPHFYVLCGHM
jgi:hypothetical protein